MTINTEHELVKELSKKLTTLFNTDIAITEFSAGYGIADLVFAKNFFSKDNTMEREPIDNYLGVKILLSISGKSKFTLEDISQITGVSKITNINVINYLISKNYIKKISRGVYTKTYKLNNPIKKIVAVEAKLKDWKQGILQARRYKSFTDECYLAILSRYEKNIDKNYLDKFGIGLILFNPETGNIIVKRKPQKNYLEVYKETSSMFAKELFLHQTMRAKTA
ncbi:hypothetical protein A3C60_01255 [Candidatus Nomurabacteria bacterium RIFCSPHIGHO2_02_FULL_37_45]|uniref:Uncharacterized protein n=2 Tax=Candidatus Nomuraibacteriota TaxID=1752729 RepID=A0A1F6Y699_9BACT|nr:MAG: hypothetical protein A2727_01920 [Candidatus Nomurabacteria bacterium RIFCSPHIGHO2_01_FULL_37_110]OGI71262.1 MAG: hypothetical protein A3C60_01255 [Candidatus Nomurabacteria bacterium RIFCSPHIGHO2_02_FULL_37_45]OGI79319.1 MAG: hypothetical protein A3F19_02380 [Candidatus Nomurabacteria bacterium RIFCSPHIGHO2_12_FULL_37_29]OGI84868.1 MAG: hypothetical protein A3A92_00890 [Candidatus Nomurabacteria bacterium RIFCSPLOWO2_01_FULL_37_49]OGJ01888.1 MAG: hypothetical protein A3G98_01170 [Candi